MFILTANNELINVSKVKQITLDEAGEDKNIHTIEACFEGKCRDYDENESLILESFEADELLVAQDVFDQLIFAIDDAATNKVIHLGDIGKLAKSEFRTGKEYAE